jgi:hypothetical protein
MRAGFPSPQESHDGMTIAAGHRGPKSRASVVTRL